MILIRYQDNSTNYRLFNPVTKQIIIARDVIINKNRIQGTEEEENKISISMDNHTAEKENLVKQQAEPY